MSVKQENTIIPLKLWQEKICKNPNVLVSEEPWNHFDEIIPCGKCLVCKRNIKRMEKMYGKQDILQPQHNESNNRNEKKG